MARFEEWARHGLGNAIGIDRAAAKVVLSRAYDRKQHRPMNDGIGNGPTVWFAGGRVELARGRRQLAIGNTSSPMVRRRQDIRIFPFGLIEVRIILRKRLILRA